MVDKLITPLWLQKLFKKTVKQLCHGLMDDDGPYKFIEVVFYTPGCTYVLIAYESEMTKDAKKFVQLLMDLGKRMIDEDVHVEIFTLEGIFHETSDKSRTIKEDNEVTNSFLRESDKIAAIAAQESEGRKGN